MHNMELIERVAAFEKLGDFLKDHLGGKYSSSKAEHELFEKLFEQVSLYNPWFTRTSVDKALEGIVKNLSKENLSSWLAPYQKFLEQKIIPKKIAVIMAGNIPCVGFHDFLSVLVSGHRFAGKVSSTDHLLMPAVAALLLQFEPRFRDAIGFVQGPLKNPDAVIATGSNNSSRYFDYYFGKYPHIIRKNRNSVAVITGSEKAEDFKKLGEDIFLYFGLGCRNVSKLYVPEGYNFSHFFEGIFSFSDVLMNNKYANNYEFNKTVYLMHSEKLLDNNFLILRETKELSSPIGVLFYEFYQDEHALASDINSNKSQIQCVVSKDGSFSGSIPFGTAQSPELWDYADGVDTLEFLLNLN